MIVMLHIYIQNDTIFLFLIFPSLAYYNIKFTECSLFIQYIYFYVYYHLLCCMWFSRFNVFTQNFKKLCNIISIFCSDLSNNGVFAFFSYKIYLIHMYKRLVLQFLLIIIFTIQQGCQMYYFRYWYCFYNNTTSKQNSFFVVSFFLNIICRPVVVLKFVITYLQKLCEYVPINLPFVLFIY